MTVSIYIPGNSQVMYRATLIVIKVAVYATSKIKLNNGYNAKQYNPTVAKS